MDKATRLMRCLFTLAASMAAGVTVASDGVGNNTAADSLELQELVVTGVRGSADVRRLPMSVTVIGRTQLAEQHQPSVLPTVAQQVPSLFVTGRAMMGYGVSTGAAGGINMRGMTGSSGQMLVLIDGHPQYNGIYGHPVSDSYQTLMAERVEVLRGPASVLYGSNAMGGVMNIVTRAMRHDGTKTNITLGSGSYGTVQTEVSNQIRSGKFSSTVSAQYNRTDNHRPRMGYEQYGGYMKAGYDFSSSWTAYVDADVTHFNAFYPGSMENPVYGAGQWITRGVVSAALENRYEATSGALSVYSNFGRHKIDDGSSDADKPAMRYFRSNDALIGVSWYQNVSLMQGNSLTAGVDYRHVYGRAYYTSKATGEVLDTPNKQSGRSYRNEIAAYLDVRQDLLQWLTVDAGLRVDHHSVAGTEWVPQVGFVIRPTETGEIKAMAGKGFRNPTMREMFLYPTSNEELEPERLWSYELSWRQRCETFSYGANIYYIKGDNMIQTVERRNVNTGKIENYGVEFEAAWRVNDHYKLTTNHSWLRMEHPVVAAPTYKGFLGADCNLGRVTLNAGLQYIGGLYTSVGNDVRKENFCLLNTAVSYAATSAVALWVRGENLLAQRYETVFGYPMPRATVMAGVRIEL